MEEYIQVPFLLVSVLPQIIFVNNDNAILFGRLFQENQYMHQHIQQSRQIHFYKLQSMNLSSSEVFRGYFEYFLLQR